MNRYFLFSALLVLGACASDVWIKPGAGAEALAQDKQSCQSEVASVDLAERGAAFERCMESRDWWHASRGGAAATSPSPSARAFAPTADMRETAAAGELDEAAPDVTATPFDEPTASTPQSVDPNERQFWFKLGAGPSQLADDQGTCRQELGVDRAADSPSRWGQSEAFDRCMRARGWTGGSVEAR